MNLKKLIHVSFALTFGSLYREHLTDGEEALYLLLTSCFNLLNPTLVHGCGPVAKTSMGCVWRVAVPPKATGVMIPAMAVKQSIAATSCVHLLPLQLKG